MSVAGNAAEIENLVKTALLEMWTGERPLTLSRTVAQERQFENWWKFEVAAALWPVAEKLGCDVWVETPARTDVSLMPAPGSSTTEGSMRVLFELKTMGTFWQVENINKAFGEPGKKRLLDDLRECARDTRAARPFGVVGLLLTHQPGGVASDPHAFDQFLTAALALPGKHGLASLDLLCESEIPLPRPGLGLEAGMARQVFWIRRFSRAGK